MNGHTLINLQNESTPGTDKINNERQNGFSVAMLKKMTANNMEDEEKELISEFKTLQNGACHPHTIGEKNKSKNRYKTIYPYDHSRVVLDPLPGAIGSDYINANYIDNVEDRKVYVAAQGPLPTTNDDFWRMIWKLNSGKIVMLTNLVENRKVKCDKYWPDEEEPMTTQTFNITLNRERFYASYVIRDITVTDHKSKDKKEIQQFHFTAWPDHGTPNSLELVLFQRRVKLHKTALPGQMVIHCSAGIGRTGTFIALDALLEFGKKHDRIDVHLFINKMRKDRMSMVQTELMLDFKPDYKLEQDFCASLLPENETKNRTMRILAADKFRAFLTTDASSSNEYINAIITQSYISRQGYIVTQFPLPETRADFWTLVMNYQCDTVVILGEEIDPAQDSQWMPVNKEDLNFGDITVKQNGTQTEFKGVDVSDVSITRKHEPTDHTSRIFRMKDWTMERQVPPSKQSILHLLEQVESRRRSSGSKPVVVTCKDGSTQCGLFCLMANARDQLKIDEEVDVLQAARQLLIRRPEFLASFDQYQFCYTILNDYLETMDCYVN
ncbi:Receptor-type tyrosine-protein phosphatase mu [Mizuhopecten yessoensis]|uniref:protein-tyrosine-phosphatase n=1 Tax=Mizuhopecten yessoensis TaxID=6573 RepID=A0A210QYD3_MIZYE|nr:Receptor-type tyrosine-protein phosphatase mu [Mizuhopecten yessoensis]